MPIFCKKAVDYEFIDSVGISEEFFVWTAKTANFGAAMQLDKFLTPQSFLVWKIRFKNQVTACSDYPSDATLWIKEVEMVDSLEELKSSRSVCGKDFSKHRDAGREDCLSSEQDHPEFSIQEEGQSRGTENPARGSVSPSKTDRPHDLRLLSSDWRS